MGSISNSYDDLDFIYNNRGHLVPEDTFEDDYVATHRRFKERSAMAFEEDLAELRRKRKDMQERMFDMVDINAEIEKAKSTLAAAGNAFQRHANKFDNSGDLEETMMQKLEKNRKYADIEAAENAKPQAPLFKWSKVAPDQRAEAERANGEGVNTRQARINSIVADNVLTAENEADSAATQPKRRSFLKRKKRVSF